MSLVHTLNGFLFNHDAVEDPIALYEQVSQLLFVGILALLFFFAPRERRELARRAAVAAAAATALALLVGAILSRLVDRPRPFVADPSGVHLFAAHAADAGFPSDHATAAFAIGAAILLRDRRWGAAVIALAAVLAIGVHYPTDVLAGALVGIAAAMTLWLAPPRRVTDLFADWLGAVVDRAARRLTARARYG
jgi:undecaprenyl-diphosphatase